jgi:hypothetical protein
MSCHTQDGVAIERFVQEWMTARSVDIPSSVVEDAAHLGIAVRLILPSGTRQKMFETADKEKVFVWLDAQSISK